MAHSLEKRAQVYVMYWTGDTPRYIAEQTGLPLTTVRRWRGPAMERLRRAYRARRLINQNGPKKEG